MSERDAILMEREACVACIQSERQRLWDEGDEYDTLIVAVLDNLIAAIRERKDP